MNIVFRTDASMQIGTGHVMRCLTLAVALKAKGAICKFICRDHPGNLISRIRLHGFEVFALPAVSEVLLTDVLTEVKQTSYAAWLGVNWVIDADQSIACIGQMEVDWLIVDHYALDASWERSLRPLCRKLMVIDDLANRKHHCDLLVDQNLGRDLANYSQLVPEGCSLLVGPNYALLRPEFFELRESSLIRRTKIPQLQNLLISMGGVDLVNATGNVLQALIDYPLPANLCITVVMGENAPWLEKVKLLAMQISQPIEVLVNVNNMAQLMAGSDLAIGAAGGASWERCCLGLPAIVMVLADNQRYSASSLEQFGCVKIIDKFNSSPHVIRMILDLAASLNVLTQLSQNSSKITDGNGVSRVLEFIGIQHV